MGSIVAQDWLTRIRARVGVELPPVKACDPVNAAMIRHWCEAMGLASDWSGNGEAPATMLQCWLFPGPSRARPPGSATEDATAVMALLAEAGYTGVVTVSTELELQRSLKPGDTLAYTSALESVSEEKTTGLGSGRFLGFRQTVRDEAEQVVGTIRFTHLAYRPNAMESA